MILVYLMNPSVYESSSVFWQSLLFALLAFVIARGLFAMVTKGAALVLREEKESTYRLPLRLLFFREVIVLILYLLFGTAFIPAKSPSSSRLKTVLSSLAVPLCGLLLGWLGITVYTAIETVILQDMIFALSTALISGGVFSLMPFPGLPGGNIIASLLPEKAKIKFIHLAEYLPLLMTAAAGLLARSEIVYNEIISQIIARL